MDGKAVYMNGKLQAYSYINIMIEYLEKYGNHEYDDLIAKYKTQGFEGIGIHVTDATDNPYLYYVTINGYRVDTTFTDNLNNV